MEDYSFKNSKKLLIKKGLLKEIIDTIKFSDGKFNHQKIVSELKLRGWNTGKKIGGALIFKGTGYSVDAYKDKVAIEVERAFIDAIHRTLFRAISLHKMELLDVMVFINQLNNQNLPFSSIKRDLEIFSEIIPYPVYLIGIP